MRKEKKKMINFDPDYFLVSYAQKNSDSYGRKYKEPVDPNRTPFQRDRDRIIHTKAFRRLQGKTQVQAPHEGDHFRTRLTHTMEVAQIARDLARWLNLNEDLAETIALAHDLGHPPFGHAGEQMLNKKMQKYGFSFEHNEQSLRVVEIYESRYQNFRGLNLTREVLEGMQKHSSVFERPNNTIIYSPHLESQIVDISDEIAYISADLEDGLRGEFFKIPDLKPYIIPTLVLKSLAENEKQNRASIVRGTIRILLQKLVDNTQKNIKKHNIQTLEDVQKNKNILITFDSEFQKNFLDFKKFLYEKYYTSERINKTNQHGQKIISNLFDFFLKNPEEIPTNFMPEETNIYQKICDYIAGMTDSFAQKIHTEKKL